MVAKLSTICQTQFCSCEKSVTEQPYMDPYARRESFPPITLVQSTSHKIHSLTQSHLSSDKTNKPGKQNKQSEHEDFSLAQFIRFLKQIKLKKLLSRINDRRQRNKIEYPSEVILQWSLSVFFFRRGSINAFHTALIKLKPQQRTVILNYLGLKENSLPDRTVVNDYLALVSPDEINELLLMLFDWAKKNKIFYNHAGSLLPNNRFHLACDGVWVHKYAAPHAVNEKGENICPYCLPRVCNRGQPNEKTYWVHGFVNLAMIFPGGLQLPLYVHALKASQIQLEATASDEKLKQESELQALIGYFTTEWLCSNSINKSNCFSTVKRGRMRADHEDVHNSLKNRGYTAKHDYARANANACLVWKILMFIAFWIFELFSFTKLAQKAKGPSSWMGFAEELFSELIKVSWEGISLSPSLQKEKIQFRFDFSP
jgi:hypothetical protein